MDLLKKKKKEKKEPYIASPLNTPMPNYAVYVMSKTEKLLVSLVAFVVGGLAGLIFYGGLFKLEGAATTATHISNVAFFTVVGIIAVKFFVPIYVKSRKEKRDKTLRVQFRDMLESLSSSFSSGSNVQKSFESAFEDLKMQYNDTDYIIIEMQEILNGVSQNIQVEVMIKDFGERSGNEDIVSFADVFEICFRKGGNMKIVIQRTQNIISGKMAVEDEIATKLTSNKMQHNMMSVMPIVIVALLKLTNEAFSANFATPVGVLVNTIAIGIFLAAYKYGTKIVDIKG